MDEKITRNLLSIIRLYRKQLFLASFMLFISNTLLIINPLILRQAILILTHNNTESTLVTQSLITVLGPLAKSLWFWSLLLLIIAIISAVLKYKMRMSFLSVGRIVEYELKEKIFGRIQIQSRAFFDKHGIGDLLSRLTNDITSYREMLGPGLMYPVHFCTLMIPALGALFYLSPFLAIISLIPIITIYLINLWIKQPLLKSSHSVQQSLSSLSSMAHEHYSGIKLIKSYRIEGKVAGLFAQLCEVFSRNYMRFATIQGLFIPGMGLVTKIVMILTVAMAGAIVFLGWGQSLSLADFLSFVWIQTFLFGPLLMLAWVMPMYQKGVAAYSRLMEVYREPIEVHQKSNPITQIPPEPEIRFENLNFFYPSSHKKEIYSHFNLTIKKGSIVGITGPVGSGKTTLFRLLNREYEVAKNEIFINRIDIHEYSLEALHKNMIIVEQLPFLFSKTIKENIKLGKNDAEEEELLHASSQADLHRDVVRFPLQYETIVGERGVLLSGGQKQRVAIARAILMDRSILLLDDIFSALDMGTEKKIFNALKANFSGKTVLLITNRVSILQQLDRIIYIKNGKIIEDGSPKELEQRSGPYKTLLHLQRMQDT